MRISVRLFFCIGCCLFVPDVFAQADSTLKARGPIIYWNNFLAGGLVGEDGKGASFTFSTTHGIRYRRWTTGFGVGYDVYSDWNTLPLFVSLGADLHDTGRYACYLQLNAGYAAAAWIPGREDYMPDIDTNGGAMINPMIGFAMKADHYRIYLAAGYKFQRNSYDYWIIYPSNGFSLQKDIERIVIQLGFGLH